MTVVAVLILGFSCASLGYMLGLRHGRSIGWANSLDLAEDFLRRSRVREEQRTKEREIYREEMERRGLMP